ncbi:hypothetical protein GGTG_12948 [Gaeumannomyces tritici R3-111a-1]|uniref:Uncharacterized protein n=1 Tax=Gaeumannomyces tritici (strain R3-111a-1) TaxID=644352 RepID=J3PHG8_GAET3|nr:hypothetical protein GGTG_12948 [Gaeumannomyces tritici R3-111a-1]EJT69329.1 hypothetical protein GGTG_12948 [Gaeumannomyces tritici R3-111a-1]
MDGLPHRWLPAFTSTTMPCISGSAYCGGCQLLEFGLAYLCPIHLALIILKRLALVHHQPPAKFHEGFVGVCLRIHMGLLFGSGSLLVASWPLMQCLCGPIDLQSAAKPPSRSANVEGTCIMEEMSTQRGQQCGRPSFDNDMELF